MATIPLFNDGGALPTPGAEGLSRVPTARMELDYGGLAQVAARAYQQPLMPKDMYEGDRIAGEAWGKAMQTLGGTLKVLHEETAKIKNEGDIAEADAKMTVALGSYESGLANNQDEETWERGWANQVAGLRKEFDSNKSLSPYAKHHIELRLQRMEAAGQVRISSMAMQQQRQKAALSMDNLESIHREQRNYAGMRAVNERRTEVGLQSRKQEQIRAAAIDGMERVDGLYGAINENPKAAREQLDAKNEDGTPKHFPWLDPLNRDKARRQADQVLENRRTNILQDIVEFVSNSDGQPIYPDDIDAFDPNGILSDKQKADVRTFVAGAIPRNKKADYEQAVSYIDSYRKLDDPSEYQLANLKYVIATNFDGPHEEQLLSRLNRHVQALDKTLPPMNEVTAILNLWMEREAFGAYKKPGRAGSGTPQPAPELEKSLGQTAQDVAARMFLISQGMWPTPWKRLQQEQGSAQGTAVGAELEEDEILKARAADMLQTIRETIEFERGQNAFSTVNQMKRRAVELALAKGAKLPRAEEWDGVSVMKELASAPAVGGRVPQTVRDAKKLMDAVTVKQEPLKSK